MPLLRVRAEQMVALESSPRGVFERWVEAHLERCFPDHCSRLRGDSGVRDFIAHGIERARVHGITSQREVCKYIDLMVTLGRDFDTDLALSWAGEILRDPAKISERARVRRVILGVVARAPEQPLRGGDDA
jgi:hypothetical protein